MIKPMQPDYEILPFKNAAAFRQWLDAHHAATKGVWLRIYKKATGTETVTHAEALDEALCYGWIDGQRKGYDEVSFLQKFTPRRPKSLWSKRNVEYIARLSEAGLMMPAGMLEVQKAQEDGRWGAAYDKATDMKVPDDFLSALKKNPKAEEFFKTLNKTSLFAIGWRLQTAKTPETRLRRLNKLIDMLEVGQKP
jgi:uncharacterized protein YdeI (YjbR/CyaY-like superfamily)